MKISSETRRLDQVRAESRRSEVTFSDFKFGESSRGSERVDSILKTLTSLDPDRPLPKRLRPFDPLDWSSRTRGRGLGNLLLEHLNLTKPQGWKHRATPRFANLERLTEAFAIILPENSNSSLAEELARCLIRLNDTGNIYAGWRLMQTVINGQGSNISNIDEIQNCVRELLNELSPSLREDTKLAVCRAEQDRRHAAQLSGLYDF